MFFKKKISNIILVIVAVLFLIPVNIFALDVNKTLLTKTINSQYTDGSARETLAVLEANYTSESWTTYITALDTAYELEDAEEATQIDVDNAKTTLINAKSSLVFAGKAALDAAKSAEAALTPSDYVDYSAVTAALALPETTNAEVVAKTTAINSAIEALVFAGKADLDTAKALAATKIQASYTAGSWSVLTTALALPETTNAQIVAKTTAINAAISGLVKITPVIRVGRTITIAAGTRYWVNATQAKAGVGGYVVEYTFTTTITRVYTNGCFNVTGDFGWFNPSLLL